MKSLSSILSIFIFVLMCGQLAGAEKFTGVVILKKGIVYLERSGQKMKAKKNMLVKPGDTIITGKKSLAGLQLAGGITTNIGSNAKILIKDLLKDGKNRHIKLQVAKGSLMSRVKPGKETVNMEVSSPTLIAAVRGTEFSVESDKEDEATIMVNEGEIKVNSAQGDKIKDETLKAGEKITADFKEAKKGILDEYEKNKFRMLDTLDKLKKSQLEAFMDQQRRNEELREQMKNQNLQ